jgi:Arylsulfotransferase (ASST)
VTTAAGRTTRRGFLAASAGLAAALTDGEVARAAPTPSAPAAVAAYRSRPDLTPPVLTVSHAASGLANGYIVVAPFSGQTSGTAMIADNTGEPVWVYQSAELVMNFRVQQLRGKPVLTWWQGKVVDGFFAGECVVADESYRIVKRFAAGDGFRPEVHEFLLTPQGTALVSINNFVVRDLTELGGPADATVIEGVVQELDVDTGKVLFEWHSLDHVDLAESPFPISAYWDYFHLNSIDVDAADGNLIVSARYPCAVYKLDRRTGEVIWRLGGLRSDFRMGDGATFWFQHDARMHPGGLLTLFDDGADAPGNAPEPTSRAIVLALDTNAMTAELVRSVPNPSGALTFAMGSAQLLHHGGFFVGWGTTPQVSEFASDGSLLFDATFPGGDMSYRAYRAQWPGRATGRPAVAAVRDGSALDLYASWNGATRVAHWRVLSGRDRRRLAPIATVPRAGFETRIQLASTPAHVAVAALDAQGTVLGTSGVIGL